jgi:predicted Zn-dependent protease
MKGVRMAGAAHKDRTTDQAARHLRARSLAGAVVASAIGLSACALNPATGERQLALERTAGKQESALPAWLSTHPAPAERVAHAESAVAKAGPQPDARVGRNVYLRHIDNLVFGKDPRDGFFRDRTFYHPRLRFEVTFPRGWNMENLTQAVVGVAPQGRAALQLTIIGKAAPDAALRQFITQAGVMAGRAGRDTVNGQPAALAEFQAQTEQGVVRGIVAFISRSSGTYQLVGYTPARLYQEYAAVMEATIRSFAPVSDRAILNVRPQRVDIVRINTAMTVDEFAREFESAAPARTLAVLNQVDTPDSQLAGGALVKRVIG